MSDSFNNESIPPWWNKKRMVSKTDEAGLPVFEEEVPAESPQLNLPFEEKKASKLFSVANAFAIRYRV